MSGPLDADYTPKERKNSGRRKRRSAELDEAEEEHPEELPGSNGRETDGGNELSAVEKHIDVIGNSVRRACRSANAEARQNKDAFRSRIAEAGAGEEEADDLTRRYVAERSSVSLPGALCNPRSFGQSVENIFHFSFLVKNGRARVGARSLEDARAYGVPPGPTISWSKKTVSLEERESRDDSDDARDDGCGRDGKSSAHTTQAVIALTKRVSCRFRQCMLPLLLKYLNSVC